MPPQTPGLASVKPIVRDGERDIVAVEEPLEIRAGGEPIAVTMRTPGLDAELAAGFLFGEGLIRAAPDVGLTDDLAANTIEVRWYCPTCEEPVEAGEETLHFI